ncbi:homeobox and leucine zipper protein Homez isoform 1-T2 [Rhinophrynus dorsalis]
MSPTTTKDPDIMCPAGTPGLVCLPPISDDLQLIWTQAELTSELDDHPQLIHTFSYFPYPSMPEIALLCLRYGLQMEKVKTWFMVQRIRCGISWSSEEIEETRSRLLYNQDQLHFKPLVAMARKASIHQTPEKSVIPASKSEVRQEASPFQLCPPPFSAAPEAKRLRTDCMVSERKPVNSSEFTTERRMQTPAKTRDPSGTYGHKSPDSNSQREPQQELRNSSKLPVAGPMFGVDGTEVSSAMACLPSEEELYRRESTPSWNMDGFMPLQDQEQNSAVLREDGYMPVMRRQRKTKEQLAILKSFFLNCQWACREEYKMLEEITGLPRSEIIQWFGDTRYALKHGQLKWFRDNAQGRPSWLDDPQHIVTQNGRKSEPRPGGSPCTGTVKSVAEMPGADIRNTGKTVRTSVAQPVTIPVASSLGQIPVAKSKAPETRDTKWGTSSGTATSKGTVAFAQESPGSNAHFSKTSGPVGQSVPTRLQTGHKSPLSNIPANSPRVNYGVLERYWSIHRHIQEADLQSLVTESGLGRQQVLDWFCHKSSEPAEVEVCLEEEDDELIEEEDEYDVIIQD